MLDIHVSNGAGVYAELAEVPSWLLRALAPRLPSPRVQELGASG